MEIITDYMQIMDYVPLALLSGIVGVLLIFGFFLAAKYKNRKAATKTRKCVSNQMNSGISQQSTHRNTTTHTVVKQSRYLRGNKQRGTKIQNPIPHPKSTKDRLSLSESVVKNWLESDSYCYERNFLSAENLTSCRVTEQENNSSIADGSDNLNSCSSNEDLSLASLEKKSESKKETINRQKKKQKRKALKYLNNNSMVQDEDVEDDIKENFKPRATLITSSKNVFSLRKHCTKSAAFKVALNNKQVSRTSIQEYNTLESFISVKSTLSSSTSSITSNSSSISSSETSSPTQSVNSSPTASPKRKSVIAPLRQYTKLNMNQSEIVREMKRYVIDPNLLGIYGFPVESIHHKGYVDIYRCLPKHLAEESISRDNKRHHCHFYGTRKCNVINEIDGLISNSREQINYTSSIPDSGHDSGESSPRYTDSDSSEVGEEELILPIMAFCTPDGVYQIFSDYCNSIEKQCVRCFQTFLVNEKGEYLAFDPCTYHWGKLSKVYDGKCYINVYSCCQGEEYSTGCSKHFSHVWNGIMVGLNGPYEGFVYTQKPERNTQKQSKIYALDCEMCYTALGLELTKVTVIGFDGSLVYEHIVKPQAAIIDYNTRFSGISERDFLPDSNIPLKTLSEVQEDLLNIFDSETILIGHGLENDLKALRLVHKTIVDTSVVFNHSTGYPYKRSLKNLTQSFLKRDIQGSDMGHCSFEDSRACLELMMWKIRSDLRHWSN